MLTLRLNGHTFYISADISKVPRNVGTKEVNNVRSIADFVLHDIDVQQRKRLRKAASEGVLYIVQTPLQAKIAAEVAEMQR